MPRAVPGGAGAHLLATGVVVYDVAAEGRQGARRPDRVACLPPTRSMTTSTSRSPVITLMPSTLDRTARSML